MSSISLSKEKKSKQEVTQVLSDFFFNEMRFNDK